MKTRKTIRILTVLFALTVSTAYVVHSQLQQSRSVAPSSKVVALPHANTGTNTSKAPKPLSVAPGSKSPAPVIVLPNPSVDSNATPARPYMFAPGSKSAPVFDRHRPLRIEETSLSAPPANPPVPAATQLQQQAAVRPIKSTTTNAASDRATP